MIGGRVSYLAALPGAVATIVCLGGLRVFSSLVFEPLIAQNAVSYGALGTVLIMQSWLTGVGRVIYSGQLVGCWFYDAWLRAWTHNRRGHAEPGGGQQGGHRARKAEHTARIAGSDRCRERAEKRTISCSRSRVIRDRQESGSVRSGKIRTAVGAGDDLARPPIISV